MRYSKLIKTRQEIIKKTIYNPSALDIGMRPAFIYFDRGQKKGLPGL